MSEITDGMVLAAGLGTRMRPLTNFTPKPLLSVAGETLLDHALATLAAVGIGRAVVNAHYLADQVEAHMRARRQPPAVTLSDERGQRLETGGGVVKALPLLRGGTIAVLNADNVWLPGARPTLDVLLRHWDPERMDALLLMVPLARAVGYDGRGDFHMDPLGRLMRRKGLRMAPFAFAGAQLLNRTLLDDAPAGAFSLTWAYDKAAERGRLFGVAHSGRWFHVGTPDGLALAEDGIANG